MRPVTPRRAASAQHAAAEGGRDAARPAEFGRGGGGVAVAAGRASAGGGEELGGDEASRASTSSAQLLGGAGERLRHAARQHVLQQRQDLVAQADAGEARVGVVRVVPASSPRAAARVVVRRTSAAAAARAGRHRRMPASERAPDPRPRPSSTVSAWSSRVWPSRTGLSACGRAGAERGLAGAAGGGLDPTGPATSTGAPAPDARARPAVATVPPRVRPTPPGAGGRRPTAPHVVRPRTAAAARVRASESAPPEQPTTSGARRAAWGRAAQRVVDGPPHLEDRRVTGTRSHGARTKSPS